MKIHFQKITFLFILTFIFFVSLQAQEKKSIVIKGLQTKVEILRDQWGVNHIYANNEHDLFFTQGYCAAKDRLFQFEVWRRQATGTVAEILGERELKRDIGTRLFKFRGNLKTELQHYHPHGQQIIQAYVDGVNAYITEVKSKPALLPIEFQLLKIAPQKWTPEIVISRHQGLLGNITQELNIGRSVAAVGDKKVKELIWFHPKDPNLQLDTAIRGDLLKADILELYNAYRTEVAFTKSDVAEHDEDDVSALDILNKRKQVADFLPEQEMEGSNNWIISGRKTASGFPMLANDPHRKVAVPSLRYIVHLVAPGWDVVGGGEPEIPGVSIGHNQFGAWGLTIYETDGEDLYVYNINPLHKNEYWYKGQWVKMKTIQESIKVKNGATKNVLLNYTVHGPVTFIDSVNNKAYAVKCAWMEPGGAPYLASLRIDQATNWESFREACAYSHIPGENMIWADKKGNIGWQAVGIVPIRKNFSGYVPIPGDGRYEWAGYLPIKERPHLLNPSKDFFATANQHVTPDTYEHWDAVGYTWADPYRGDRINKVLSEKNNITLEDMGKLQTDYFSIPASSLVPLLANIKMEDSFSTAAKQFLLQWNFELDKKSIAAGIYAMWEKQLAIAAQKYFVPDEIKPWVTLQLKKVIERLQNPTNNFGAVSLDAINNRDAFVKKAFELAIINLKSKLGTDMNRWQYGQEKYKHVTLEHPLAHLLSPSLKEKLNIGPLPRGGNGQTPGSTGGADNQASGASFRILIDTKNWDNTLIINTPGQSGDSNSPFYRNLFSTWANDSYFPSYYSRAAIEKTVVEKWVGKP
ncbi:MAG: penicillin acylase family protein [Bacteroidetes bacterium]|nr:penicillin acylase family protein [Bacteroidota bacterium]